MKGIYFFIFASCEPLTMKVPFEKSKERLLPGRDVNLMINLGLLFCKQLKDVLFNVNHFRCQSGAVNGGVVTIKYFDEVIFYQSVITVLHDLSWSTGCPRMFYTQKCKILRIFISIKTIEFGTLIYLSDRAVLLAFWRILNQGNRPNKTENTWHYVKRVIFAFWEKKFLWAIQPTSWHDLFCLFAVVFRVSFELKPILKVTND